MKVFIGADHAGFELKERLKSSLPLFKGELEGETPFIVDLGPTSLIPDDDYPAIAKAVAEAIAKEPGSVGILSCANAVGVCVVANKTPGIRAGVGFSIEAARTMRSDDDANILCIPGRIPIMDDAVEIAKTFLQTKFSNEERHKRRIAHI